MIKPIITNNTIALQIVTGLNNYNCGGIDNIGIFEKLAKVNSIYISSIISIIQYTGIQKYLLCNKDIIAVNMQIEIKKGDWPFKKNGKKGIRGNLVKPTPFQIYREPFVFYVDENQKNKNIIITNAINFDISGINEIELLNIAKGTVMDIYINCKVPQQPVNKIK